MNILSNPSNPGSLSSNSSGNYESLTNFCQNIQSEARLQQYQIEQQQQEIKSLKRQVQVLELHKATQLGQDKIVGFMVGAIVLSLLSLATSIFFTPSEEAKLSLRSEVSSAYQIPNA
jgi:hypothetical protein